VRQAYEGDSEQVAKEMEETWSVTEPVVERIMPLYPTNIHDLIQGTYQCHLIWQKGFCRCD
jgi:hypothetical protein